MPRKLRVEYPGAIYHVMNRGDRREAIFKDAQDRELFLATLGVRLISPWKVEITNLNPFPWPVRVKYRGMQVLSTKSVVSVTFPDGEQTSIDRQIPCILEHGAGLEEA